MASRPSAVCFGAAHWDVVARAAPGTEGVDRPGVVDTRPGGVALNVAAALVDLGVETALVSAIGGDEAGTRLLSAIRDRGIDTAGLQIRFGLPTGQYVAIEGPDGELLNAVAETRALGTLIPSRLDLADFQDADCWVVDANLSIDVLNAVATFPTRPGLAANPVSEAKASVLKPIVPHLSLLYCNRREAEVLCNADVKDADEAAQILVKKGVQRVVVTDGSRAVADVSTDHRVQGTPPGMRDGSVTGAGDAFMAGHLAAALKGAAAVEAIEAGFRAVEARGRW